MHRERLAGRPFCAAVNREGRRQARPSIHGGGNDIKRQSIKLRVLPVLLAEDDLRFLVVGFPLETRPEASGFFQYICFVPTVRLGEAGR